MNALTATPADTAAALARLDSLLAAMPPVAALGVRADAYDGDTLSLRAPLAANVNDKGCAFGGSLAGVMTLSAWGLLTLRLHDAGLAADVYVQDSQLRYLAPVYDDLLARARLADGVDWPAFADALRTRGRARATLESDVVLSDGRVAASFSGRFVAMTAAADA